MEAKSVFSICVQNIKHHISYFYIQSMLYLILLKFHDLERILVGPNFKSDGRLLFMS